MTRHTLGIAGVAFASALLSPIALARTETITVQVNYESADGCVTAIIDVRPTIVEFDSIEHLWRKTVGDDSIVEWSFVPTGAPATDVDWYVEAKDPSSHQVCDPRFQPSAASCKARSGNVLWDKNWKYSVIAVPKPGSACAPVPYDPAIIFVKGKGTILVSILGLLAVVGILYGIYRFLTRNR